MVGVASESDFADLVAAIEYDGLVVVGRLGLPFQFLDVALLWREVKKPNQSLFAVGLSMGVRFACHVCAKPLNIKQELAGRRGVCPGCGVRFRIPLADAQQSTPLVREVAIAGHTSASSTPPHQSKQRASKAASTETSAASATSSSVVTAIDPLGDASISTWYVRPPSGGQYGPATTDVLRQWIQEGRVAATALLWREGWAQWREAREILSDLASEPSTSDRAPSSDSGAVFPGNRSVTDTRTSDGVPAVTDQARSDTSSIPATMQGNPQIGKVRRERSLRRTLTIGILSIVSVTLIVALVAVVRSTS